MRLSQFGFNVIVAAWLLPFTLSAWYGNAHSTGVMSDLYALAALICTALLGYAVWSAYAAGKTTTPSPSVQPEQGDDVAISVSFEKLGAIKWVYCLIVSGMAVFAAIMHYLMNRDAQGFLATLFLVYALVDIGIAFVSFNQFWAIKSGKIMELSNKASNSMFQH